MNVFPPHFTSDSRGHFHLYFKPQILGRVPPPLKRPRPARTLPVYRPSACPAYRGSQTIRVCYGVKEASKKQWWRFQSILLHSVSYSLSAAFIVYLMPTLGRLDAGPAEVFWGITRKEEETRGNAKRRVMARQREGQEFDKENTYFTDFCCTKMSPMITSGFLVRVWAQ